MKNIKLLISALCLAAVASFAQNQMPVLPTDLSQIQYGLEYLYSATDDDQYGVFNVYICGYSYDVVGGNYPTIINFTASKVNACNDASQYVHSSANIYNKDNILRVVFYEDNSNSVDALGMVMAASGLQEAYMKHYPVNLIYKKDPHRVYENTTTDSYPVYLKAFTVFPQ